MKRIIILIIIVFLFLQGCKLPNDQEIDKNSLRPSETTIKESNKPNRIVIYIPEFFWSYDFYKTGISDDYETWYKTIYEKFNISVTINPDFPVSKFGYTELINGSLNNNQEILNGIFEVDYIQLLNLIESNEILPIGINIQSSNGWKSISEEFSNLAFIEGEYWGVPKVYNEFNDITVRGFRKDWLDNLELDLPKNINEFFEVCSNFVQNDPDDNGLNDTSGIYAQSIYELVDVFESFDVPLGKDVYRNQRIAFSYNALSNRYEDVFIKANMYECLSWLHLCYQNNIINEVFIPDGTFTSVDSITEFKNAKTGSITGSLMPLEKYCSIELDYCIALSSKKEKYINQSITDLPTFYVLGKNINTPKESIDWFIKMFYEDEEGYLLGRFGNKKYESDGYGGYNLEGKDLTVFSPIGPRIFISNELYDEYNFNLVSNTKDYDYNLIKERSESIYNLGVENEVIYKIPFEDIVKKHLYINSLADDDVNTYNIYNDLIISTIYNSVTGVVSIDEALTEYKKLIELLGVNNLIEELNNYSYFETQND